MESAAEWVVVVAEAGIGTRAYGLDGYSRGEAEAKAAEMRKAGWFARAMSREDWDAR